MITVAAVGNDLKAAVLLERQRRGRPLARRASASSPPSPPQFDDGRHPGRLRGASPARASPPRWSPPRPPGCAPRKPGYRADQVAQVAARLARATSSAKGWDSRHRLRAAQPRRGAQRAARRRSTRTSPTTTWRGSTARRPAASTAPIWRGGGPRTLRALVDKYEDPADVYRIVFPPHARVRVTLKPRFGNPDLAAFTRTATSTADDEQIIGRSRRNGQEARHADAAQPVEAQALRLPRRLHRRRRRARSTRATSCGSSAPSTEPMSTELGAGAWSYFGDPRAISHDGHTFTGWISTTGNVWVAHIRPDGSFTKRSSTRASASTTTTTRRSSSGPTGGSRVLLPALRPRAAAAEVSPEPDALPDLQAPALDRGVRARCGS